MQKIIRLIIPLLLITSKITAMSSDTIYYECREELSFDTIPYMVKDQAFLDGLNELRMMLNDDKPYSLKRAEFLVEWAYSSGKMDYEKFCHDIDSVAYILKQFIAVNNIQQYKTAPNFALFEYFTKPSPMLAKQFIGSYRYDGYTSRDGRHINNVVYDSKSNTSLGYRVLNEHRRSHKRAQGNTYQFYIWQSIK